MTVLAWTALVAWIIQLAVGLKLFGGWLRAHSATARLVQAHAALVVVALGGWIGFAITGNPVVGWLSFAVLNVGLTVANFVSVRRQQRRQGGATSHWKDYRALLTAGFRGELPRSVTFHLGFSAAVFFPGLAACIAASVG